MRKRCYCRLATVSASNPIASSETNRQPHRYSSTSLSTQQRAASPFERGNRLVYHEGRRPRNGGVECHPGRFGRPGNPPLAAGLLRALKQAPRFVDRRLRLSDSTRTAVPAAGPLHAREHKAVDRGTLDLESRPLE